MSTEAHEAVWKRVKDQDATIAALTAEVGRLKNDRDNLAEVADIWHQERHQALRDRDHYKAAAERLAGMWQSLTQWLTAESDRNYANYKNYADYKKGGGLYLQGISDQCDRTLTQMASIDQTKKEAPR